MTLWMLYAIGFGALAVVAGSALERAGRVMKAPGRFVWLAMLLAAVGGPLVLPAITRVSAKASPARSSEPSSAAVGAALPLGTPSTWMDVIARRAPDLDRPLALLWFCLSGFCFGRFVSGIISLRRRQSQWVAREILGTKCFVTPDIGPAVVTMPETRIIVPEWALSLDQASLATVIRHERQHKLARDGWLIVAGSIAAAVVPWNPAAWMIRRRLHLAMEMDCDARVLAEDPRVDRYGSLLLAIAQRPRLVAGLAATLTESTSDLERRIDAMTARPPKHPRARGLLFAAAGAVAIAVACSMPAPDMVAPHAANPTATPGVLFDFQVEKPASADPKNVPPRYPEQLRAAGIQGAVVTKFVVDTTGRADMRSFQVLSTDHEGFVVAVREALPDLRFFPAEVHGHKVKQLIQMPFSFSLSPGKTSPATAGMGKADSIRPRVVFETHTIDPATRKPVSRAGVELVADSTPQLVEGAPPVYPAQLRAAGIQGMVQAKFVVRPDGKVDMESFMVMRSDHEAFAAAVRAAVEQWRFNPVTVDGKPVSKLLSMPFMFSLSK